MSTPRLAVCLVLACLPLCAQRGEATYRVTFQSTWSPQTHPNGFPANPHYSPLVGATHLPSAVFWRVGDLASPGMQEVAELGGTQLLVAEVGQQIAAGLANQALDYGGAGMLGTSPGAISVTFTTTPGHSHLTLVSMLAPSPDWFVGLDGVDLVVDGDWVETLVVPAVVYDAGTDSGVTYGAANVATNPPTPIAVVSTASGPFAGAPTEVGTFTIQRLYSTIAYGCLNPLDSIGVAGAPRLGASLQFTLTDTTGQLSTPAVAGLAIGAGPPAQFPCGAPLPGFGLAAGAPGEVLLAAVDGVALGPTYTGAAVVVNAPVPNVAALVGQQFYFQGLLASTRVGLTRAVAVRVGM